MVEVIEDVCLESCPSTLIHVIDEENSRWYIARHLFIALYRKFHEEQYTAKR
jgi:hypothetical protein